MKIFLIIAFQIPLTIFGQTIEKFVPDEIISGFRLEDSISALKKYPKLNQLSYSHDGTTTPFGDFMFYNKDSTQTLALIIYPGSYKNCFSVVNVRKANNNEVKCKIYTLTDQLFVTESGIKIGMTKSELIAIKGLSYQKKTVAEKEILSYKINLNDPNDEILKRYKMPEYYANYIFRQTRLIEFEFGFTYP